MYLGENRLLTEEAVENAGIVLTDGGFAVRVSLPEEGKRAFERVRAENAGNHIAFLVDGEVCDTAVVRDKIA